MIIKEKVKKVTPKKRTFRGRVTIDLHNHNSGFTERIETENLVTDVLDTIAPLYSLGQASSALNSNSQSLYPLATVAFGGLMLFDNELTESASNIDFPSNAHLVGFAGRGANSTEKYQGSYNALESEWLSNGHKAVWDFSTAQANGTIMSVARTNFYINYFFNNFPDTILFPNVAKVDASSPQLVFWDTNSGYLYTKWKTNSPTQHLVFKSDTKVLVNNLDLQIYHAPKTMNFKYKQLEGTLPAVDPDYWAPDNKGNLYSFSFMYTGTITKASINTQTDVLTYTELGQVSNLPLDRTKLSAKSAYNTYAVTHNYLYMVTANSFTIYKINLLNLTDITAIDLSNELSGYGTGTNYPIKLVEVSEGVLLLSDADLAAYSAYSALLYEDGHCVVTSYGGGISAITDTSNTCARAHGGLYLHMSDYSGMRIGIVRRPGYLGTIANIEPVTKTAAQSMKVTYTLTNE